MILKNEEDELSLSFYVNNVIPAWKHSEWGFPKGRRNKLEDNMTCAIREFNEESDYNEDDYIVLKNKDESLLLPFLDQKVRIQYSELFY